MDDKTYKAIEEYMQGAMEDSAHDALHVYRVLHQALVIAEKKNDVNRDVLIASCLLHDVGRSLEFQDPSLCHAVEGGKLAYAFLHELGWDDGLCAHVKECVTTHRYRTDNPPKSIEAKIVFDADKLDVTGALGIARSLIYKGQVGEPLYTVTAEGEIQLGSEPEAPESFMKEYHYKLIPLYGRFFTEEAFAIARGREAVTRGFYNELLGEISIDGLSELLAG